MEATKKSSNGYPAPSRGGLIAGGGALVLLITLFLPWYKVSTEDFSFASGSQSETVNAWNSFGLIDVLLLLIAVAVLALVAMELLGARPAVLPLPRGIVIVGLAAFAILLILFRVLVSPDELTIDGVSGNVDEFVDAGGDFGRSLGIFLALLSAGAMAVGGWLCSQGELDYRLVTSNQPKERS